MKDKLLLKQILPVICESSELRDEQHKYLTNNLSYREVLDFLDCEVVDISTDGYDTIKITIKTGM